MKNLRPAFFSLLVICAASASAEVETPFHIGLYGGDSTINVRATYQDVPPNPPGNHISNFKAEKSHALAMTLAGAWQFADNWMLEMQLASSLKQDSLFRQVDTPQGKSSLKVGSSAFGTYIVYKAGGETYVKGKLGLGISNIDVETNAASDTYSKFGYSYGIAVGQKLGIGSLEITYMRYPDVSISNSEFGDTFDTGTASTLTISRYLRHEIFSFGYVFSF
ncbi:MAG TPA: outer membrane beta-barrel protein [Pseudomonadales bacterium]